MGNCLNIEEGCSCFTISERKLEINKIFKAYKSIKRFDIEMKSKNILKKDKVYLISTNSIQDFVNNIEIFSNLDDSEIRKKLEDNRLLFDFDNLEIIDESNYNNEILNEFIIVDEEFLKIIGKNNEENNQKSVVIDIDKNENKFQIEFANQMKKRYVKLGGLNFCYKFESAIGNQNLTTVNDINRSTKVYNNNIRPSGGLNEIIYISNNSDYNGVVFHKNYS